MNDPLPNRPRSRSTFLILLLAAFAAGVLLDRAGWLPGSAVPPGLGRTFGEAWRLVEQHYVDRSAVKPGRMTDGAIEGMLASLGDVGHTTYATREELQELEQGLKGEMEGIGARVTLREHRPTVMDTVPNSPARAAGLEAGDVIVDVNGKPVASLPLQRVVQMVRGPAGTEVRLRIQREGLSQPLDFTIRRAKVDVPEVAWHLLPGTDVAHLAIHNFGNHADEQLKAALDEARQKGARKLILDVRGNPGGLKDQAVAVTSEFLTSGNVFLMQDVHGQRTPVAVKPGGVAQDIPLCVLIDEGTASSAEIFAGAIQDHHRGKLVGAHTFGTGTVLQPFVLSDGSAVLLAVAEWLTPDGRSFWHKGIPPDIAVSLPPNATVLLPESEDHLDAAALGRSTDTQLLKAIEVLGEKTGTRQDKETAKDGNAAK
jgi:carboxyl-terminal processing protease